MTFTYDGTHDLEGYDKPNKHQMYHGYQITLGNYNWVGETTGKIKVMIQRTKKLNIAKEDGSGRECDKRITD